MRDYIAVIAAKEDSFYAVYIDKGFENFFELPVIAWGCRSDGQGIPLVFKAAGIASGLREAMHASESGTQYVTVSEESGLKKPEVYLKFCDNFPKAKKKIEAKKLSKRVK